MSTKLLLADDSITIQRVVELTFSGEDVQVLAVGDGEEAIARIPAEKPDIILADIGMPKRSGYEVSAFVKGRPELERIPVLLLAGAFEPVDEIRAKAARCDGVLVKPFEPQHVIARVRELVDGAKGPAASVPAPQSPAPTPAEQLPSTENLMEIGAEDLLPADELFPSVVNPDEAPLMSDDSLDEYFDKLDEAFATINASARPSASPVEERTPVHERPITESDLSSLDDLPDASLSTYAADDALDAFTGLEALEANEPANVPTLDDLLADIPSAPAAGINFSAPLASAPAVPTISFDSLALALPEPGPTGVTTPAAADTSNVIADAFAALLAVEAGEPGATPPRFLVNGFSPVLTEAMLEDVARRVAQRLALGSSEQLHSMVKEIVSRVSERLVREEIDRIRRDVPRS